MKNLLIATALTLSVLLAGCGNDNAEIEAQIEAEKKAVEEMLEPAPPAEPGKGF